MTTYNVTSQMPIKCPGGWVDLELQSHNRPKKNSLVHFLLVLFCFVLFFLSFNIGKTKWQLHDRKTKNLKAKSIKNDNTFAIGNYFLSFDQTMMVKIDWSKVSHKQHYFWSNYDGPQTKVFKIIWLFSMKLMCVLGIVPHVGGIWGVYSGKG